MSIYFTNYITSVWLVASVGAASVLIFVVPKSPLSQPRAVVLGHVISATVGVTCARFIELTPLAVAAAVALSIFFMQISQSMHPPGGAASIAAVLGGPEVESLGYGFVLFPTLLNVVLLLLMALISHRLMTDQTYPALIKPTTKTTEAISNHLLFTSDDLKNAIEQLHSPIDVAHDDLIQVYQLAHLNSQKRRLGEVCCKDIMSIQPIRFEYGDELNQVWSCLVEKKIKAAPVVDRFDNVIGIVTSVDFMRHVNPETSQPLASRLKHLLSATKGHYSNKPEVVGQVMTSPVTTVSQDLHIIDLIPLFNEQGIHHLPVVDSKQKLIGMITRTDLLKAIALVRQ
ncbi:MAG: HPP family protein [Gammaproteobacteria bacterium]|nr:HPP family protein [Gammaproteobacteria bacterium]MDH5729203.1 HPP family protein [Gammaproteobacteria bacterium]